MYLFLGQDISSHHSTSSSSSYHLVYIVNNMPITSKQLAYPCNDNQSRYSTSTPRCLSKSNKYTINCQFKAVNSKTSRSKALLAFILIISIIIQHESCFSSKCLDHFISTKGSFFQGKCHLF